MQWPDLIDAISRYAQQEQPDISFTAATPVIVNAAELRIYRDLELSATTGQNTSLRTAAGQTDIDMTQMSGVKVSDGSPVYHQYPVAVDGLAALVGTRWIAFQAVSLDFLQMVWPDQTVTATPSVGQAFYCMVDDQTGVLAPVPDAAYTLRVTGLWRPAPMSATNPRTWLGDNLSDLMFAAVMLEVMAYQRDFGAQADNPQAALSWEAEYQFRLHGAKREEALRKGLPVGQPPAPPGPPGA